METENLLLQYHTAQRTQHILALARSGMTGTAIGKQLGVSGERVRQIAKEVGFSLMDLRPPKPTKEAKLAARKEKAIARFWSRVDQRGPDECWEWLGYRNPDGYGHLTLRIITESAYAHQLAFELANGYKSQLWVLHSCDNPPCCNPAHLREGTPKDNMRDSIERGRAAHLQPGFLAKAKQWGESRRKVTPELQAIFHREHLAGVSRKALAAKYHVHYTTVATTLRAYRATHSVSP